MKLSVIIANYNHRDFVGTAIESALAIDWEKKEVIVVDDASTDDSRIVIGRFDGRVAAYFRPKSNQLGVHKFGFERSTGDIVIFLDSDDVLEPEVMREVAKVWRPEVSKVQYRMNLIDAGGTQLDSGFPQFPATDDPAKLRRAFLRTMAYTTPPGSGNAYAREFVKRAYSSASPSSMRWSDDILLTLAPIMGDVLTIRKPLARYRIHAGNHTSLRSIEAAKLRDRLSEDVEKASLFLTVARQHHLPVPANPLRYSFNHLQYRLALWLIEPAAHPFPSDRLLSLVSRLIYSAASSSQIRFRDKVIMVAWAAACAVAPRAYRRILVLWRFAPTSRPAMIKTLLGVLTSLRSPRLPDRA
jgi:glycosyltransferase involved in cell wall biosynthesis